MRIERNVYEMQCKSHFIQIQIRYTVILLGKNWLPNEWHGLKIGLFAPTHNPRYGYRLRAFYCCLLPGLPGAVNKWPKWYRFMRKQMSSRRTLSFQKGWD